MPLFSRDERGQIQVTFNWIYIAIAGAVILIFFLALVIRQKDISEENLSFDLIDVMQSILVAAGASEDTKQRIDTSGLLDYTLSFSCQEGVTSYGIDETSARVEDETLPIFSPDKIRSSELVVWSLPYEFPYKVSDFLFVSGRNVKYILLGGDSIFQREFANATNGFNVDFGVSDIDLSGTFSVRVINMLGSPNAVDPASIDHDRVTMVVVNEGFVSYYQKVRGSWQALDEGLVYPIVSLGGERDAALYGSFFAASGSDYACSMQKAFTRLRYVNEVYGGERIDQREVGGRLGSLLSFYEGESLSPDVRSACIGILADPSFTNDVKSSLAGHQSRTRICLSRASSGGSSNFCSDLIETASSLRDANQALLEQGGCIALY